MPLPLKDRKIAAVEYVMRKMKGGQSYGDMKHHNEYGSDEMIQRTKPESDYSTGMKQAMMELMEAMKNNNSEAAEKSLKGFISMMIDVAMDEHNMYYHQDDYKEKTEENKNKKD